MKLIQLAKEIEKPKLKPKFVLERKIKVLEELWEKGTNSEFIDRFPHISHCSMTQDEWEEWGCPHTWKLVEESGDLSLLIDTSYWMMVLFQKDEVLGHGDHEITSNVAVVFDKEEYKLPKYIWT